jgi:hypothetical protein
MNDPLLMYVTHADGENLTLAAVGGDNWHTILPVKQPIDIARNMLGRQVWIKPNVGFKIEVLQWVPLPKYEPAE